MLLNEIKEEISKRYPGKAWKDKVKAMRYNQAYAILMRFRKEDEKKKEKEHKKEEFHQITMYEYLKEKRKEEN